MLAERIPHPVNADRLGEWVRLSIQAGVVGGGAGARPTEAELLLMEVSGCLAQACDEINRLRLIARRIGAHPAEALEETP